MMQNTEYGALELTPTWAIALVCSIFVLASFALVRAIHYTGRWLNSHREKSLNQALDKIKEELMLLGFISLLLTVFQPLIASICMPHNFHNHMLPCRDADRKPRNSETSQGHSRRLLFYEEHLRRLLSEEASKTSRCIREGKVPFVSKEGLHKLHIFIFVLAVVHVVYSCLTLVLGRYKVNGWNAWEKLEQVQSNSFCRQTTFLRRQADPRWISSRILSWIVCFFRQFGRSVTAAEYKTLRMGFIRNHNMKHNFDFHKYVLRVLEDDFKKVVGISGYLWAFVVIFLLLNVNGWHTYFWIAFLPLGLLLIVGAKLQHIIMVLAMEIGEVQNSQANLVFNLRDELFWFNKPKLVLYLLHFILFQNAFELAFFVWIWAAFGFNSCFMENLGFLITRLVIGVIVQVLCSYSTLPLYALVTQMGKHFKFGEEINSALSSLHARAKKKSTASSLHVQTIVETAPGEPAIKSSFQALAVQVAASKSSDVEMVVTQDPNPL